MRDMPIEEQLLVLSKAACASAPEPDVCPHCDGQGYARYAGCVIRCDCRHGSAPGQKADQEESASDA